MRKPMLPNKPFFVKKRNGEGKAVDFAFEALGMHGGDNEKKNLSAMNLPFENISTERIHAIRQQVASSLLEMLHGELKIEADYLGGIHINRMFLFGTECRFFLNIAALVNGDIYFSKNDISTSGGKLTVNLNAKLNRFTFYQSTTPGGDGAKTINVNACHEQDLFVEVRGHANFVDFELTISGVNQYQVELTSKNACGQMSKNRRLTYSDLITADKRTIIVCDKALN